MNADLIFTGENSHVSQPCLRTRSIDLDNDELYSNFFTNCESKSTYCGLQQLTEELSLSAQKSITAPAHHR